jgi:hypothetical protein
MDLLGLARVAGEAGKQNLEHGERCCGVPKHKRVPHARRGDWAGTLKTQDGAVTA